MTYGVHLCKLHGVVVMHFCLFMPLLFADMF